LNTSEIFNNLCADPKKWLTKAGVISKSFPANYEAIQSFDINEDLVELSDSFNTEGKTSKFKKAGIFLNGKCITCNVLPITEKKYVLGNILCDERVDQSFYIESDQIQKWEMAKSAQKTKRITAEGFQYNYSVGAMKFPDSLDEPARTIVTGEGGKTPSRFKHVVNTEYGYRRLTPEELEKINMFPPTHTKMEGITDAKRAFFMGNALVIGIVERIGLELQNAIQ
jgi:DNA (cytosine-5)-methyltransferase 1